MSDRPKNISTEHQPKGSAVNLSDTLNRPPGTGEKMRRDSNARQGVDDEPPPGSPLDGPGVEAGTSGAAGQNKSQDS